MTRSFYSLAICASKGRYPSAARFFRTHAEAESYSAAVATFFASDLNYKFLASCGSSTPGAQPVGRAIGSQHAPNQIFVGTSLIVMNALTNTREIWELIIYRGKLPCASLCLENAIGEQRDKVILAPSLLYGLLENKFVDVICTDRGKVLVGRACHIYLYLLITNDKRLRRLIEAEGDGSVSFRYIAEAINLLESVAMGTSGGETPAEIIRLHIDDAITFGNECGRIIVSSGIAGKLSDFFAAIASESD